MTDTAAVQRPPVRPIRRSSPSRSQAKHHLEPNPFEKSFSSGPPTEPSRSHDGADRRSDLKSDSSKFSSTSTPPLSTRPGAAYRDRTQSASKAQASPSGAQDLTSTPKPLLPPVASITSPANEANHYPWAAGLTSSLRSGPLSPAMLAGPQSSHFDPNSFRTGFTPDLSNFKTGLTPLGAGPISFPPPSPNTAAFLAAMVNSTSAASTSAATITPNTLSALSGNPINPLDASTTVAAGASLSSQPQNFGAKPLDSHDSFDLAFSRTFGTADRDPKTQPGSKPKAATGEETEPDSTMPRPPLGTADMQQQASQAASGLFLLSQAQQEISKREGSAKELSRPAGASIGTAAFAAANAPTSLYESTSTAKGGKGSNAKGGKAGAATGNKRKKSTAGDDGQYGNANADGAAATKKAKTGKKAASEGNDKPAGGSPAKRNSLSGDDHFEDVSGDDSGGEGDGGNHKGEEGQDKSNMDEKRKNFLERNRQAALKCRQRKKAWLASLQAKVEYLQNDNENLQNTVGALRNEIMFLKSQLVQAQGGAPPGVPMSMPMGMPPIGPHGDPHHSMAQPGMPIASAMGPPHPAYMHPATSAPPQMTQAPHPAGIYSAHAVPRPSNLPANPDQRAYSHNVRGRPRSEGDVYQEGSNGAVGPEEAKVTDQPISGPAKHEREWSNPGGADVPKSREMGAATIKV
ncbi:Transcription factor [Thecaphora frezii]